MISGCLWLGINSTENTCVLPISWGYGDYNASFSHGKEELMWIGEGKLNLLTLHNPNLGNFQGGREKEGQKWSAFDFPPLFEPFPSWHSAQTEFRAENLTERQKTIREARESTLQSTLLNCWEFHKGYQAENCDHLTTAFRSWNFLLLLLFQLPL